MKASVNLAYTAAGLAALALRRLFHRRGLYAVLLGGWITAIALMAAIPMYTDAVNQRLLRNELNRESGARRPAFGLLFLSTDAVSPSTLPGGDAARQAGYPRLAAYFAEALAADFQLPVLTRMHFVRSDLFQLFPSGSGPYGRGEQPLGRMNLGFIRDLEAHAALIAGSLPAPPAHAADPIEVLIHRDWANQTGMQIGEVYVLYRAAHPDPATPERPFALPIRVAGIWQAADPDAAFWYIAPSVFVDSLLVAPDTYLADLQFRVPRPLFDATWYVALDGGTVRAEDVPTFQRNLQQAENRIQQRLAGTRLILSPEKALLRYQADVAAQSPVLLALGLPVVILILLFVAMTASSLVERQRLEVAILFSRGCSLPQMLGVFALQGLVLSLAAVLLGIPAGLLAANLMGTASSLLVGGGTPPPALFLFPAVTTDSLRYAGLAVLLVNAATLAPVWRLARSTVVQTERRLARPPALFTGTGVLGDGLALTACAYGWYLLRTRGHFALPGMFQGVEIWENPLLFLTPCLFLWNGARLLQYLWPGILRLLEHPVSSLPGFTFLLALRNLTRNARLHIPLLNLLALTTGLGAFVTSAARTLDQNVADSALYAVGATLAVAENAKRFAPAAEQPTAAGWVMPPFDLHRNIPGVRGAARVGRFPVSVTIGQGSFAAELYGIDRADWPQVGFFREDFADQSLGALMNALAVADDGLLVSTPLLAQSGYAVGDVIPIRGLHMGTGLPVPFRIVGHLDYFPTAYPPEELFLVGNLEYVHTQTGGPLPYYVWLDVAAEATGAEVQAVLEERGIEVLEMKDARSRMAARRSEPARLGLFGFLALGYAATVWLSVVALAVHAVLNAHRRRTQLGLAQAMGMLPRQAGNSLALEQVMLTSLGIGGGTLLGYAASYVFIPFLQGGQTAASRVPPYVVRISWDEVLVAAGVMAAAAVVITVILRILLARLKLFETLKLGELHG